MRGEIFGLGIVGLANAIGSLNEITMRAPKLNVRSEQAPIRPRFAKGHSYTACVDDAHVPNCPVELHVSVPTNHQLGIDVCENRQ